MAYLWHVPTAYVVAGTVNTGGENIQKLTKLSVHIALFHPPRGVSAQLGEENARMKHEWLTNQTQLVSSATETEQLAEKVRQ